MTTGADHSDDNGGTILVQIPLRLRQRGGRKLVITPEGPSAWTPPRARVDSAMVKAIARAYRWRKMLESGIHATIAEIAAAEKINESYVGRVLRLTLLAPDIVEAILGGRQSADLQLDDLLQKFPVEWLAQRDRFGLVT
ncbi:MAG: hypothetical protein BGN91_07810 [Nitrobacter sp. 62-13]|uniref:hypothetical protein n=1 Tax=Nitrobacter sp. 62-13 TaxID=1895797 RepID=UPI00095F8431|nr:hypothetical protein [Nitrobacter sp. 62-13]OJU24554.1 MAG: hypothetical protein BGN91_07810 [Nitrobacter sp. 62-13]